MEISFTPLFDSSFPKTMELGCSDVLGSVFGCTIDPGCGFGPGMGFVSTFGRLPILGWLVFTDFVDLVRGIL